MRFLRRKPTLTVSAGVLFLDDRSRVLMVKQRHKVYWDLPGGIVEPLESPIDACWREVHEELGLHILEWSTGSLLVVDHVYRSHLNCAFMAFIWRGFLPDIHQEFKFGSDIQDVGWFEPHKLNELLSVHAPILNKRIGHAVNAAYCAGGTWYLENGNIVHM